MPQDDEIIALHPTLGGIITAFEGTSFSHSLTDRAEDLASRTDFDQVIDYERALEHYLWILQRSLNPGIDLTAAGYLKPSEVTLWDNRLPALKEWPFRGTIEVHIQPLMWLHRKLKDMGIVRKYKNRLLPSAVGKKCATDPQLLWKIFSETLIPRRNDFAEFATVLILLHIATTDRETVDIPAIVKVLNALGFATEHGEDIHEYHVYPVHNELFAFLDNIGENYGHKDGRLSAAAISLVRQTLCAPAQAMPEYWDRLSSS